MQVAAYPTVSFVDAAAIAAAVDDEGFTVRLSTGESLAARKLVLAFGISDELPAIPGLVERWGRAVLHCPYCHGYEFSGRRLGVLYVAPKSIHQALLIAEGGATTSSPAAAAVDLHPRRARARKVKTVGPQTGVVISLRLAHSAAAERRPPAALSPLRNGRPRETWSGH